MPTQNYPGRADSADLRLLVETAPEAGFNTGLCFWKTGEEWHRQVILVCYPDSTVYHLERILAEDPAAVWHEPRRDWTAGRAARSIKSKRDSALRSGKTERHLKAWLELQKKTMRALNSATGQMRGETNHDRL